MTGWWYVLPGALVGFGACLAVLAFRPRHAQLADAIAVLGEVAPEQTTEPEAAGLDRLGVRWIRARKVVAPLALERRLRLRGRSLARHYAHKLLCAGAGFLAPLLLGLVLWVLVGEAPVLPALLGVVLAAVGFVVPDLLLRGAGADATEDATEALLTYFDLVTLERLANQSGTQALHSAAALSDVPVFGAIRASLERARLEQRAPYADLKVLGGELELPALADLADVMRLDEHGASLSSTLRARVRELRDAHLTTLRMRAAEVSERMTLWMVIPSLVFGLFFLVPPLLTLVGGG